MPLLQELMLYLKTRDNRDFIESTIAYFGAPVVEGLKCGALINLTRGGSDLFRDWLEIRDGLAARLGIEFAEVSVTERSILILVYRAAALRRSLSEGGAAALLKDAGYDVSADSIYPYIARLVERFSFGIPHEVGLFLDYPAEDVRGFIENDGKNAKFTGYWKVYGNEVYALRKFEEYRRAETKSARALLAGARNLVEAA